MKIESPKDLAPFVKARRQQKGWTQQQLADAAEVSQSTISRLERGIHAPDWLVLHDVLVALCIGLELFECTERDNPGPTAPKTTEREDACG